jgi:undecaprenyl-diphosphatase
MLLKRIEQWDQASFCRLFSRSSSRLMFTLSLYLSKTADGPLYLLLAAILLGLDISVAPAFLNLVLCSFAIELPLYLLLKHSIKRARPAEALNSFIHAHIIPSDRFSLPSGHTAGAFVVACAIAVYFPLLLPLALGWACGIGLSRIMLGVHFPLDIIAGAILGVCSVFVAFMLIN